LVKSKARRDFESARDRWTAGKGDFYRPVDLKKYGENYDRIFRKGAKLNESKKSGRLAKSS